MYFQRWADQDDLTPFFEAGRAMGFRAFELSHILSPAAVATVDPARVAISAVHHPCPTWAGPAGPSLTAVDLAARRQAAAALVASVETAARVGAGAVVVHLGRLPDPDGQLARWRFELVSRHRAGQAGRARYQAVRDALAGAVAAAEPACLERLLPVLAAPAERAAALGVALGIETGYDPDELPTPAGAARLLAAFPAAVLGAWLDTGHVAARSALGLGSFEAWFEAVGGRWLGAHHHDALDLRDHLVPGDGTLDFAGIGRRLPRGALATLEVDWYYEPAEVVAGARRLRAALGRP
jgi:sugar phosphate isomerase/epimerase